MLIMKKIFLYYIFGALLVILVCITYKNNANLKYHEFEISNEQIDSTNYNFYYQTILKYKLKYSKYSLEQLEYFLKIDSLTLGGHSESNRTERKYRTAIVVPYRERHENLKLFLFYIHSFLVNQQLDYTLYLIEPVKGLKFNRGLLMNIGFRESLTDSNHTFNCFIFHDVDMLPENNNNIYECNDLYPVHFAVALSSNNYKLDDYFKERYFGGINAFTKRQFIAINGFSNKFFGWGKEDDDLSERVRLVFKNRTKLNLSIGRYYTLGHKESNKSNKNNRVWRKNIRLYRNGIKDGFNTSFYKVIQITKTKLYTHLLVKYKR